MLKGLVNRRKFTRIPFQNEMNILLESQGRALALATATNISSGGIQFYVPKGMLQVQTGETVELIFNLPELGETTIPGEICYLLDGADIENQPVDYFGLKFLNISGPILKGLEIFCLGPIQDQKPEANLEKPSITAETPSQTETVPIPQTAASQQKVNLPLDNPDPEKLLTQEAIDRLVQVLLEADAKQTRLTVTDPEKSTFTEDNQTIPLGLTSDERFSKSDADPNSSNPLINQNSAPIAQTDILETGSPTIPLQSPKEPEPFLNPLETTPDISEVPGASLLPPMDLLTNKPASILSSKPPVVEANLPINNSSITDTAINSVSSQPQSSEIEPLLTKVPPSELEVGYAESGVSLEPLPASFKTELNFDSANQSNAGLNQYETNSFQSPYQNLVDQIVHSMLINQPEKTVADDTSTELTMDNLIKNEVPEPLEDANIENLDGTGTAPLTSPVVEPQKPVAIVQDVTSNFTQPEPESEMVPLSFPSIEKPEASPVAGFPVSGSGFSADQQSIDLLVKMLVSQDANSNKPQSDEHSMPEISIVDSAAVPALEKPVAAPLPGLPVTTDVSSDQQSIDLLLKMMASPDNEANKPKSTADFVPQDSTIVSAAAPDVEKPIVSPLSGSPVSGSGFSSDQQSIDLLVKMLLEKDSATSPGTVQQSEPVLPPVEEVSQLQESDFSENVPDKNSVEVPTQPYQNINGNPEVIEPDSADALPSLNAPIETSQPISGLSPENQDQLNALPPLFTNQPAGYSEFLASFEPEPDPVSVDSASNNVQNPEPIPESIPEPIPEPQPAPFVFSGGEDGCHVQLKAGKTLPVSIEDLNIGGATVRTSELIPEKTSVLIHLSIEGFTISNIPAICDWSGKYRNGDFLAGFIFGQLSPEQSGLIRSLVQKFNYQ